MYAAFLKIPHTHTRTHISMKLYIHIHIYGIIEREFYMYIWNIYMHICEYICTYVHAACVHFSKVQSIHQILKSVCDS